MLSFNSIKLDKVLPQIEQHVRNELRATEPIPYEVGDPGEAGKGSVYWRTVVKGGGDAIILCYLFFDLPGPRPASLQITVNKHLVGCYAGPLQYRTMIARTIAGGVDLQGKWIWGKSKFYGDDERACEKLNGNKEFIALANKFSRTKLWLGGGTLEIPRTFGLVPKDSGSQFIAVTLPDGNEYDGKDGKGLGIRDFFKLADMFEAIL